jgi:predicted metal-dependent phosphoesterase TrpH
MKIDLHVHSTYSDGVHTPAALVEMAYERDVIGLSIADHDCVDGIQEAVEAARGKGIEVIAGVELSSEYQGKDLHILGYGFDPAHEELGEMLRRFRETRERRGLKIVENLQEMGVDLDPADVLAKNLNGSLGRPHIAELLVEHGYVYSHSEAFARYLGEHSPAYVQKHKITPAQAINYIHSARGLAFIAHPGYYLEEESNLHELISFGFDGIETIHPNHSANDVVRLTAIAGKYGLLMSGGTDFHGFSGKNIPIGELDIPKEMWKALRDELGKRRIDHEE